jgi:hypothetical protein
MEKTKTNTLEHFPIPDYWNWMWFEKFTKKKENIVTIFKSFFREHI